MTTLSAERVRQALRGSLLGLLLLGTVGAPQAAVDTSPGAAGLPSGTPSGPVILQQAPPYGGLRRDGAVPPAALPAGVMPALPAITEPPPAAPTTPGEFDRYVELRTGEPLARLGADLVAPATADYTPAGSQLVPSDYMLGPGDEIYLQIWGAVDASLNLVVDRAGRVAIPRVGSVPVSGVRYGDLEQHLRQVLATVFRNFDLSATLGNIRGLQIHVTGFAQRPGSYVLNSLSTVLNAVLAAGGPSSAGSFRKVTLLRKGKVVSEFDLYALLVQGDKSKDVVLQDEDVLHFSAVGPVVAMTGSVNRPAIFEIKSGETLQDVLNFAGGLTSVADRNRIALERLEDSRRGRLQELPLVDIAPQPLNMGDLVWVFSGVDAETATEQKAVRVKIHGQVKNPGTYVLPPGARVKDLLDRAGGLTSDAYTFGTELKRPSVAESQQANYERAIRELEVEIERQASIATAVSAEDTVERQRQVEANRRLLAKLRSVKPSGRVIITGADRADGELPPVALENGDELYIPPTPSIVGVYGAVFSEGAFLYVPDSRLGTYLDHAGGPRLDANKGGIFVIRADGSVRSNRQYTFSSGVPGEEAKPGDTVYVPVALDRASGWKIAKDFAQIFYQFGLGAAGIKVLSD